MDYKKVILDYYVSIVRKFYLECRFANQKPLVNMIGSDARFSELEIQKVVSNLLINKAHTSETFHPFGFVKITASGKITASFKDLVSCNPRYFPQMVEILSMTETFLMGDVNQVGSSEGLIDFKKIDGNENDPKIKATFNAYVSNYRGDEEWLNRLKAYYIIKRGKNIPSIEALYSVGMLPDELCSIYVELSNGEVDFVDPLEVLDLFGSLFDQVVSDIDSAMKFVIWLGNNIPILVFVDSDSTPLIFSSRGYSQNPFVILDTLGLSKDALVKSGFASVSYRHFSLDDRAYKQNNAYGYYARLQKLRGVDLDYTNVVFPDGRVSRFKSSIYKGISNILAFAEDEYDIIPQLRSREVSRIYRVDRPRQKLRRAICEKAFDTVAKNLSYHNNIKVQLSEDLSDTMVESKFSQLTNLTAGLTSIEILEAINETLTSQVNELEGDVSAIVFDFSRIVELRKKFVEKEYLEIVEKDIDFSDIMGQDHVKECLHRHFIDNLKLPNTRDLVIPGFLFMGRPGVGKSHIIGALSKEMKNSGVPPYLVVKLDVGALKKGIVGESERTTRELLDLVKSLSEGGLILFIDEIDLAFVGRGEQTGDSNVSKNILKSLMEFFGSTEYAGRVVPIAASNFPLRLDSAVIDRFQMRITFDPLDPDSMSELVKYEFEKLISQTKLDISFKPNFDEIVKLWSVKVPDLAGRSLVNSVRMVLNECIKDVSKPIVINRKQVESVLGRLNIAENKDSIRNMMRQAEQLQTFKSVSRDKSKSKRSTQLTEDKEESKPTKKSTARVNF